MRACRLSLIHIFLPQFAHFVLKQRAKRLNDLLEINVIRQAAYIMVALDHRRVSRAGFNDVGINGALHQIIHRPNLLRFFLEYPDKLLTNDLALGLRIRYARPVSYTHLDVYKRQSVNTHSHFLPSAC